VTHRQMTAVSYPPVTRKGFGRRWMNDATAADDPSTAEQPDDRRPRAGAGAGSRDDELSAALRAAQGRSEAAFREVYRHVQPRLLRYLTAIVATDAEDVAADAWVQVVRRLGDFDGDIEHFRRWVTTIGRTRAIDHTRRKARRRLADEPVETMTDLVGPDDPEAAVLTRLATDSALSAIIALPPDQAEAVLLRTVLALTPAEAARILGKRPAAVRVACRRGLQRLARDFARTQQFAGTKREISHLSPASMKCPANVHTCGPAPWCAATRTGQRAKL
jgi:RNA polymerase sigma-70 factor, ECF subfamily